MYMRYNSPVELYSIINDVVDSMRETASITNIEATGVNFKYTAANTLSKDDFISITDSSTTNIDIKILEADSTSFTIKTEYTTAISFKANAPYYMHEKEKKAAEILTVKTGKGTKVSWQKYPLILLTHPHTDNRQNNTVGYEISPTIHIITDTNSDDWSDDRYTNNFEPILFPLYNSFINALAANEWISEMTPQFINHDKTDLLHIDGNPFPDKMDGITLQFNDLEIVTNNVCEPTPAIVNYALNISHVGEGVTSPDTGIYSRQAGTSELVTATPLQGNEFVEWDVNGDTLDYPAITLVYDGAKTAVATFQSIYQKIIHQFIEETTPRIQNKDLSLYVGTVRTVSDIAELVAAIAISDNYDIIQLNDGTYISNEDIARGYILFNTNKKILLRGNSGDNTKVVIRQNAANTFCIRLRSSNETVFQNLTITSNQSIDTIYQDGGYPSNAIFDRCNLENIADSSSSSILTIGDTIGGTNINWAEFKNSTLTKIGQGHLIKAFNNPNTNQYLFTDCILNGYNYSCISLNDSNKCDIAIYDSNINQNSNIPYALFFGTDTAIPSNTLGDIDLRSNTISYGEGFIGRPIFLGRGTRYINCINNIITSPVTAGSFGIISKTVAENIGESTIKGNYIEAERPIYIKGGSKNDIQYNSFIALANRESFGFVNYKSGVDEVLSNNNIITNNNLIGGDNSIYLFIATGESVPVDEIAKTCIFDNNKCYYLENYLYSETDYPPYSFEDRMDFWEPTTNSLNSTLVNVEQLPIELP